MLNKERVGQNLRLYTEDAWAVLNLREDGFVDVFGGGTESFSMLRVSIFMLNHILCRTINHLCGVEASISGFIHGKNDAQQYRVREGTLQKYRRIASRYILDWRDEVFDKESDIYRAQARVFSIRRGVSWTTDRMLELTPYEIKDIANTRWVAALYSVIEHDEFSNFLKVVADNKILRKSLMNYPGSMRLSDILDIIRYGYMLNESIRFKDRLGWVIVAQVLYQYYQNRHYTETYGKEQHLQALVRVLNNSTAKDFAKARKEYKRREHVEKLTKVRELEYMARWLLDGNDVKFSSGATVYTMYKHSKEWHERRVVRWTQQIIADNDTTEFPSTWIDECMPEGFKRLTTRPALANEGLEMHHCAGSYGSYMTEERFILSYTAPNGKRATVEVDNKRVRQSFGEWNRVTPEAVEANRIIVELMREKFPDNEIVSDASALHEAEGEYVEEEDYEDGFEDDYEFETENLQDKKAILRAKIDAEIRYFNRLKIMANSNDPDDRFIGLNGIESYSWGMAVKEVERRFPVCTREVLVKAKSVHINSLGLWIIDGTAYQPMEVWRVDKQFMCRLAERLGFTYSMSAYPVQATITEVIAEHKLKRMGFGDRIVVYGTPGYWQKRSSDDPQVAINTVEEVFKVESEEAIPF